MRYFYFVSYSHPRGFGNTEITTSEPLAEISHIRGLSQAIEDDSPSLSRGDVVVISYQLMRTEENDL